MPTQHHHPFAGLLDFVNDINRGWDRVHGVNTSTAQQHTEANAWIPDTDIAVTPDQLIITMDLAGIPDDDIDVIHNPPNLTVTGQRHPTENQHAELSYHTRERSSGHFRRSITLPTGINREDLTITTARGLLIITMPQPEDRARYGRQAKISSRDRGRFL